MHEYCKACEGLLCYIYTFSLNSFCLTFQTSNIFQHCSGGDSSTSHQTRATQNQQAGWHINRNTSCATSLVIPTTSWKQVETTYGISNRFQPLKLNLPVFESVYQLHRKRLWCQTKRHVIRFHAIIFINSFDNIIWKAWHNRQNIIHTKSLSFHNLSICNIYFKHKMVKLLKTDFFKERPSVCKFLNRR